MTDTERGLSAYRKRDGKKKKRERERLFSSVSFTSNLFFYRRR